MALVTCYDGTSSGPVDVVLVPVLTNLVMSKSSATSKRRFSCQYVSPLTFFRSVLVHLKCPFSRQIPQHLAICVPHPSHVAFRLTYALIDSIRLSLIASFGISIQLRNYCSSDYSHS